MCIRDSDWVFHGCNRLKTIKILHEPEFMGEWLTNRSTTFQCMEGTKVDEYCDQFGYKKEYVKE